MKVDPSERPQSKTYWPTALLGWLAFVGLLTHVAALVGFVLWLFS